MTITAQALVEEARKLIGTPWVHQGRTRLGVDCIGLVVLAAQNAGIDLFKFCEVQPPRTYSRKPSAELFHIIRENCTPTEDLKAGSLLFFQFKGDLHPRHFGIMTERGTMIHAESRTRQQVIEHGYRAQWLRWKHSVWLLPGVIYE